MVLYEGLVVSRGSSLPDGNPPCNRYHSVVAGAVTAAFCGAAGVSGARALHESRIDELREGSKALLTG